MYGSMCLFVMHYSTDRDFTRTITHSVSLSPSLSLSSPLPPLHLSPSSLSFSLSLPPSRFVMHYGIDPALYRDKLLDAAYQALEGAGGFPASHPGGAGDGLAGGVVGSGPPHAFGQQHGRSFGAEEEGEEGEEEDEEEGDVDGEALGEDGDPDGEEMEEADDDESWADDESAPEDPAYDSMSPPPSDPAPTSDERVYSRQNNQQRRPAGNRDAAAHPLQVPTRAPLTDRTMSHLCYLYPCCTGLSFVQRPDAKHLHRHRQMAPLLDTMYRIFVQAPTEVDMQNIDIQLIRICT